MRSPRWWPNALKSLSERDPVLAQLIHKFPKSRLVRHSGAFQVLINSIIGQQISVKAADAVRARLKKAVPLTPSGVLETDTSQLLSLGLSQQKAGYFRNIAHWFVSRGIDPAWFEKTPSEEIEDELLRIKGIGKWTLQMFQIFYLQEANILPISDLGLVKAAEKAYGLPPESSRAAIEKMACEIWKPYSTAAVWFLWRSLDPEEVHY